jgi:hypothetical protein
MRQPHAPIAIGLRVKSGWAVVVLVGGSEEAPEVIDCRQLELSDPGVPESRQPYHAGFGTAQTNPEVVSRLVDIVGRSARAAVAALLDDCRSRGHHVRAAALVVGSVTDPDQIGQPHIRAHAAEGRLFRQVIERALADARVACSVWLGRTLVQRAAVAFARPEADIKRMVTALGSARKGSWRADQKMAAIAAWLALAGQTSLVV